MPRVLLLFLAAALALITGCATSQPTPLGPKTYPPRPKDYIIDVYVGNQTPIGVLQSIANPQFPPAIPDNAIELSSGFSVGAPATPWDSLISDAMTLARELGGDALVIGQREIPTVAVDALGHEQRGKVISMTVIRYNP